MGKTRIVDNSSDSQAVSDAESILNDDILEKIFDFLSVKQLLRIERVSKQFQFCVDVSLKRKRGLYFGSILKNCLCDDKQHSLVGGNVSDIHNNEDTNQSISRYYLQSFLDKSICIKCLYLNQSIDLESVRMIVEKSPKLECLCLGNTFLESISSDLESFGQIFSNRIRHMTAACYFIDDNLEQKNYQLLRHFRCLSKLTINHFKPLGQTLNYLSDTISSLRISSSPFWFSDMVGDSDVEPLLALIERNKSRIKSLHIDNYFVSDNLLDFICKSLDLNHFSLSSFQLRLNSVLKVIKSQKNLWSLSLNGLSLCYKDMQNYNQVSKIRSLSLISSHFEIKPFLQLTQMFRSIEKLEFNDIYFRCECNTTEVDYFCQKCNDICFDYLANLENIKVLNIHYVFHDSSFWNSVPKFKNLHTIETSVRFGIWSKTILDNIEKKAMKDLRKIFTIILKSIDIDQNLIENLQSILPTNVRFIREVDY